MKYPTFNDEGISGPRRSKYNEFFKFKKF